ncbi:CRTAC1 family protein [Stappia sp. TSB10P1A]|uniref:CRTAC1 family protein n=1 Tax=Stappia sp. TSB10P1A TaxID=2003585 RepID=UPI001643895F|nr:CRTAC1 family protein [Stappia sp. TSB10P1A]
MRRRGTALRPAWAALALALLGGLQAPQTGFADEAPAPVPVFVEEAKPAGIDHSYTGPWEYFVGGGAAILDCDGDRRPDLFLAGGDTPSVLYRNRSATGGPLAFEPVETGIPERLLENVTGAYPLDIDNDGIMDLVLLRVGENQVLRGIGDCRFEPANRRFSFNGGRGWTTGFAAVFEKDLAFPTLAFGNYVDRSAPGSPWGTCDDNVLHRPRAGEAPDYSESFVLTPGYCSLSMLFTDWNRSGEPALRISNDRHYYRGGEEQLWALPPGRPPRPYRRSDGWRHLKIWGMGIASTDLDGDGLPEYALTSMGDTKLQTIDQEGDDLLPVYRDIAFERGVTAHRPYTGEDMRPSTGWHAEFQDVNNDTLQDLFIAKGNVEAMPDFAAFDPDNLLIQQWNGRFVEQGDRAGIALDRRGRGAGLADFNMDGLLDLVVVNREAPVSLFRNLGREDEGRRPKPLGNWIAVALSQDGANRNAVGAKLSIRVGARSLTREIGIGGGHASGQAGFVHVGLGVAERAVIRVRWPDGNWSHGYRVFANQFVLIQRGDENARYWYPPR